MQSESGKRVPSADAHRRDAFAIIKGIFAVRRFLLRGLEKVRTEWCCVCTAYNLKKLIAKVAAVRGGRKQASQVE